MKAQLTVSQRPAVDRLDEFDAVKPSVLEMLSPRYAARG